MIDRNFEHFIQDKLNYTEYLNQIFGDVSTFNEIRIKQLAHCLIEENVSIIYRILDEMGI